MTYLKETVEDMVEHQVSKLKVIAANYSDRPFLSSQLNQIADELEKAMNQLRQYQKEVV